MNHYYRLDLFRSTYDLENLGMLSCLLALIRFSLWPRVTLSSQTSGQLTPTDSTASLAPEPEHSTNRANLRDSTAPKPFVPTSMSLSIKTSLGSLTAGFLSAVQSSSSKLTPMPLKYSNTGRSSSREHNQPQNRFKSARELGNRSVRQNSWFSNLSRFSEEPESLSFGQINTMPKKKMRLEESILTVTAQEYQSSKDVRGDWRVKVAEVTEKTLKLDRPSGGHKLPSRKKKASSKQAGNLFTIAVPAPSFSQPLTIPL
jgi:hypothetical protein